MRRSWVTISPNPRILYYRLGTAYPHVPGNTRNVGCPTAAWDRKSMRENVCPPYGTRIYFPLYRAFRLRLHAALNYFAPAGLDFLEANSTGNYHVCFSYALVTHSTIGRLRLLRGAQQDFADERLRFLGHQHNDGVRHIVRLKHLLGVFVAAAGAEAGVHRTGTDPADPDILRPQFFRDSVAEPV